jgi:hypothetical protein
MVGGKDAGSLVLMAFGEEVFFSLSEGRERGSVEPVGRKELI